VHDVEKIWGTMMSEVIVPVDFVVGVLSLLIIGVILGFIIYEATFHKMEKRMSYEQGRLDEMWNSVKQQLCKSLDE